jgi:hypothetical protein
MMTREDMAKVLGMVSALDGQKIDEAKLEMWFRVLGDYSFDMVEKCIVPAYKECSGFQLTAKELWQNVRREAAQPVPRQWVLDLHNIGEHFECRAGEFGHPAEVTA